MTKKPQHLVSFLALSLFLFFAVASSGVKHMTFTTEQGQLPPEFAGFNDTLLVIEHPGDWGYDKYLRKNFKNNYHGPYKIIDGNKLNEYPVQHYRYFFDNSSNFATQTTTYQSGATHSFTYASSDVFMVIDRTTNKSYVTQSSAYYSKLMRAYIQALDAERNK
jgi:hypothetical protein